MNAHTLLLFLTIHIYHLRMIKQIGKKSDPSRTLLSTFLMLSAQLISYTHHICCTLTFRMHLIYVKEYRWLKQNRRRHFGINLKRAKVYSWERNLSTTMFTLHNGRSLNNLYFYKLVSYNWSCYNHQEIQSFRNKAG